MIVYLIKVMTCSAIFIAVYHLFLEREKMHSFNRFYLLGTVFLSMLIPMITIELTAEAYLVQTILPQTQQIDLPAEARLLEGGTETSPLLLLFTIFYGIIVVLLLARFSKNLVSVIGNARKNKITSVNDAHLVILNEPITPHTFLSYIFINKEDLNNHQILTHELTHFRQRHSLDILFIELMQCILWFNPALIFYKRSIRLNHEFLADESVINHHKNVSDYQKLLLRQIGGSEAIVLASCFNYSVTKKRFTMMTTTQNKRRSLIKAIIVLLLVSATSAFFSNKVYSQAPAEQGTDLYTIFKDGKWQNQKLTTNPEPVEGIPALMKSLLREINYPASAKTGGVEGDVTVMFEVDAKGKPTNYSVVKKLQNDCDAEVVSTLKNSAIDWRPAELNGQNYVSRFVITVNFRFEPSKSKYSHDVSSVLARPIPEVFVVAPRPEN